MQIENFERKAKTYENLGLRPYIVTCYYVRCYVGIPCFFAEFVEDRGIPSASKSCRRSSLR